MASRQEQHRLPDGDVARALDQFPDASLITDADQRILYANSAFLDTTGYRVSDLLGRNCRLLQGPDTDPAVVADMRSALDAARPFDAEILNYRADGEPFWNHIAIRPLMDETGTVTQFVSSQTDVTDQVLRRRSDQERRETTELLLDVARRLATATLRHDVAAMLAEIVLELGFDRSAVALLGTRGVQLRMAATAGWPADLEAAAKSYTTTPTEYPELADLIAFPRQLVVNDETASDFARRDLETFQIAGYVATPVVAGNRPPHGLLLAYWRAGVPAVLPPTLADRLTDIAALAAVALDKASLIEQIQRDADEDGLTRLMARAALERALEERLSRDDGARVAVVYGDVDHLKRVNDVRGHHGGDELLRQIGRRLKAIAGPGNLVGRAGGDEFIVVLSDVGDDAEVEAFVRRLEEALRAPIDAGGQKVYATMSIGWATTTTGRPQPSARAAELLMAADSRMYHAKRRRHGSAEEGMLRGEFALRLDTDLHDAVANGRIVPQFQPQYDLRTGALCGYEALARWEHAELGPVPPSTFIPLAEDNRLIHPIGAQILEQATAFIEEAQRRAPDPLRLQVNVSTRELARPDYPAAVLSRLEASPARRWLLGLEITESSLIVDRPRVQDALTALRAQGVGVAIDDFGSGYSSLSQLQELPATELKIDKSFIRREGAVGTSMLRAILALGHSLGLQIIAEGVETREQLATLRALGCDAAQGFLLGAPLPAQQALRAPLTIPEV